MAFQEIREKAMSSTVASVGSVAKVKRQDIGELQASLQDWLAKNIAGFFSCRITSLKAPANGGLSGETFILELAECGFDRVVVKKDVQENATNPQSNFFTLIELHKALNVIAGMRVPRLLGVELSAEVLGAPFVVMEFVAGNIPADVPSYAASGWVYEASASQRRHMWESGVDFLVQLHRLDLRKHGLEHLQLNAIGRDPLERCLNYSIQLFRDEAKGRTSPVCESAIDWLIANRPVYRTECLNWGDARIGNIIWRDFECAAVIDWEMGACGYPGIDLGWWSFFHRWSTYGNGLADLDGMCVGQQLADLYESRGGDRIDNFRYYEVLAAIRGLSIWLRTYDVMRSQGAFGDLQPLEDSVHMIRVLRLLMSDAN